MSLSERLSGTSGLGVWPGAVGEQRGASGWGARRAPEPHLPTGAGSDLEPAAQLCASAQGAPCRAGAWRAFQSHSAL